MDLNERQEAAVRASEQNILVVAPPGAGKTRVLVERAAHLIENKKVSPFELLLLTFTRKAAGEMRTRLVERIGNQAHHITIGTFHAVALGLIQRFGEFIGLRPRRITVYGAWEQGYLLKEIAIELGIYKKSWNPKKKDIDKVFNNYYNSGIPPEKEDPAYTIFKAFAARLRENNSLTYGSILTGLSLLLPHIEKFLKWKHIMTDESQDSDKLQWYLVREIQRICKATLFCVTDLDQSIYSFRGAVPEYLIEHQDEFATYKLEINYRSDGNIVEAANKLISHNKNRIEKTMKPFKDAQAPITIKNNLNSAAIVGMYMSLEEKDPGCKRAILARNHFLLKKISQIMDDARIPNTYIGKKTALTNSEEFRRFHGFLKLIVNEFDNFSFLLIRELLGVTTQEYAAIRLQAAQEGRSHFQVYNDSPPRRDFFNQFICHDFAGMVASAIESFDTSEIVKFIQEAPVDMSEKNTPVENIRNYLSWLATWDISDEQKEDTKGVQLMTMHAAKGLEFPTVIIAGVNEGILPSNRATDTEEMESERRLCFVAITRAEDKLIITTRPETSEFHGKVRIEPVSRFVGEMGG